jgi:hypothetical protein
MLYRLLTFNRVARGTKLSVADWSSTI